MTVQENRPLTQQLTTKGDSNYSGININVNGGHVCLVIGQECDNKRVLRLINSVKKEKKRGILPTIKRWLKKKCTRSAEDNTKPIQESSDDVTSLSCSEFAGLPAEEHSRKKRVTPVTEDESDLSVSADDNHWSNHSSCRMNDNKIWDETTCQSELLACQKNTYKQEEDQRSACLPYGNLLIRSSLIEDDTSEGSLNSIDLNDSELTSVKQFSSLQNDLKLLSSQENSSILMLDPLKPFSSPLKIPVDESTNNQDKRANVESQDYVNVLSERSFSSGYPDKTISSQCHESTHSLSNDGFSNQMCGRNPEFENDQGFEDSFQNKNNEAVEKSELVHLVSSPCIKAPFEISRKTNSDSSVADDINACPDSCSSRDTNAVQMYAAKSIMKSNECHENKGDVILQSSKEIESFSPEFSDKRCGIYISFNCFYYVDEFHKVRLENFILSVPQGISNYGAVDVKKLSGKIENLVLDSTWNGKPQPNACADHRYFHENGKEQIDTKKYSLVSVLHKKDVHMITAGMGMNDAIELFELLRSVMSWKQTEPNVMDDYTITDSKSVCDRKSSGLDCLEKGKFSDKLVVKEELPTGRQTDKRVVISTLLLFHHDTFISWLMTLLRNEFTASLGTKPSDKTRSSVINGDVTVRMTSLLLKRNDLIITCRVQCLDLSLVSPVGLNIHFSCGQYSQVVDLEEYIVPVSAGKNVTIGTEECLAIAVFQKQTVHNEMNDGTITDSRPVSDIESSDLDFVGKGKFSDKLVVTEDGPMGNQTERFSHSTLPSSCDVDVEAGQKKKTRKHKKKYRKKCKKSGLPHGETSSLASFSLNEHFSDDNSIPFGYHHSNHQAPRRRKGSPENAKPPSRDNSDIKQFCSNLVDSGIGVDPVSASWCTDDVESELVACPNLADLSFGASLDLVSFSWCTDDVESKLIACPSLADSSFGASLDPVSVSWCADDVESELIGCPIRKRKIRSFVSLRHVKNSYSFKKQCNKFFRNQLTKKAKSIVRELRVDHRYLQFINFGLGSYFDRLNNGSPPSLQEQMRYEWIRLASFQHYTGTGNALNLARNGFYHSHTDGPSSTRCAYCDETRSNWEYFDNIEAVHRQISPNCPFHGDRTEESSNVSINCDGPRSSSSEAANQNSEPSTSENSAVKTYTLKPSLNLASAVDKVARGLENTSVSQEKSSKTNEESVSQQPTEDPEGRDRRTGERVSGLTRTSSNAALPPVNTESRSNRAQAGAGNFVDKHAPQTPAPVNRDSTPTALENVKHPEYSTVAQRVNSFQGFPEYLDQTPEQMALAGFYFVGVADFTRCFCCGGGLRNWEAGDDPLLEHTRWFPRCEYVLRLKGERYVAAVQRRHQEHMEQQRRQQIEIANQRDANRNPPDPMTTDAASVMREMGYADQRIRETILAVRRQIGTHMITTQQVLSWLLDQDDDSTTTTAASSVYQTGHETNSIYTGINMASEEDDSNYTTAAPSSTNTTVSTTAVKTRESVQGSGSNNATAASSGNGNQQTDTKSTASGANASLGPSSQTGAKRNGKKKKAKGNTKTGQPAGTTGGPGTDAARKLQAENEKLRDMQTCKVCMERPVNTTMLPCGHLVCCDICASRLRDCPVCRKRIKGTVKTFMS